MHGQLNQGYCLTSQEIRAKIAKGLLYVKKFNESKVQPSSFEPTIGDELYVLDTQRDGLLRPQHGKTIRDILESVPERDRQRRTITDGYELKKGFTYLLPLEERVMLEENELVRSSPKSTSGRTFLNVRMLADHTPSYDETHAVYAQGQNSALWLLVQPQAFNVIIHPGLSLNQLRFMNGDAKLGTEEVREVCERENLIQECGSDGNFRPGKPIITDSLQLHLDLEGKRTYGVVGWRARHNPDPIDLIKEKEYDVLDYFEPVVVKPNGINSHMVINPGEYYIVASAEVLYVPPDLNIEMEAYSQIGFSGMAHFAGFFDNGWKGKIVGELRSDEPTGIKLHHGMPLSKLRVYRTITPDKVYGAEQSGAHYQFQSGPTPSKQFKPINYRTIFEMSQE